MFTGIIRHIGTISHKEATPEGVFLTIETALSSELSEGDSVSVNGACLTVLSHTDTTWTLRLMEETLKKTALGELTEGSIVNLERPLAIGDRLDGHFVQGHVDGVAKIVDLTAAGDDSIFTIEPDKALMPYIISKGSIALDGVSLTVVDVTDTTFTVSIMPYTKEVTTFGSRSVRDAVHIEVDMVGKYVASFVHHESH